MKITVDKKWSGSISNHLTATDIKAIKAILKNKWMSGSTKRKHFKLNKIEGGFIVVITETYRNDYGAVRHRTKRAKFKIS